MAKFSPGLLVGSAVLITLIAVVDARQHMRAYAEEPGQHFERACHGRGSNVLFISCGLASTLPIDGQRQIRTVMAARRSISKN